MNVKIDINAAKILRERGMGQSQDTQKYLVNNVARRSDPYVPKQSGTLKNSKQTTTTQIIYNQPYAHYQWRGMLMVGPSGSPWARHGERKHDAGRALTYNGGPMRGQEWTNRMLADHLDEIVDDVKKFIGGRRI